MAPFARYFSFGDYGAYFGWRGRYGMFRVGWGNSNTEYDSWGSFACALELFGCTLVSLSLS